MDFFVLPEQAQLWFEDILVWIGYGTVVGLLAKAIMPGRDPGGTVATLAMGVTGVVIGCGVWTLFNDGVIVTPISLPGICAGTAGAFTILAFYRVLGGFWVDELETVPRTRRRRRRRRHADYYDD